MSRRVSVLLGLVASLALVGSGCTFRYSQAMVGRIDRITPRPIQNSDSGIEVGLVFGGPAAVIAFSEPTPAKELSAPICEYLLSEADYRGTWYAVYFIGASFPEVKTTGYCLTNDQ